MTRTSRIERKTKESDIVVELDLDGTGKILSLLLVFRCGDQPATAASSLWQHQRCSCTTGQRCNPGRQPTF